MQREQQLEPHACILRGVAHLQPYAIEPAAVCGRACNRVQYSLQPYAISRQLDVITCAALSASASQSEQRTSKALSRVTPSTAAASRRSPPPVIPCSS